MKDKHFLRKHCCFKTTFKKLFTEGGKSCYAFKKSKRMYFSVLSRLQSLYKAHDEFVTRIFKFGRLSLYTRSCTGVLISLIGVYNSLVLMINEKVTHYIENGGK